tara:strand:- start:339 stop:1280 length:942 start_codon:yes stop_codon:yes gene_type:complete
MRYKNFLKYIIISLFLIILYFSKSQALENKILFKIDNEIVTTIDIYNELKFLKIFNQQINDLSNQEQLEIAKNTIMKDKIKKVEILKFAKEIKVEDKFILGLVQNKYKDKEISSIDDFEKNLELNSLDVEIIREKLAIELIWNDLIFQKFSSKISIDKKKIEKEVMDNSKKYSRELSISEIIFNISKKKDFENKYSKILEDINLTGFKNAALIHSVSDTATVGGYIGWIKEDNLNPIVKNSISNLKKGELSQPILTSSGFIILKIEDEKEYKIEANLDEEIKKLIKYKTNEQLSQFSRIYFNKIKKNIIFNEL